MQELITKNGLVGIVPPGIQRKQDYKRATIQTILENNKMYNKNNKKLFIKRFMKLIP